MYQEKYWRELDQLKVHIYYLESYLEKTIKTDRLINMFLAISSSGSIAGWVVWKDFSFFWAFIIASSQVINAIKIYLPYSKRLKSLQGITNDLESLFLSMESDWYNVSEGMLTDEETHILHMRHKQKRSQIINKYLGADPLPNNDNMLGNAKINAASYFNNFYVF